MSFSTRSIISRFIAFGHVGHGFGSRRNRKPRKTAEELHRELERLKAEIAFHKETRRMIEAKGHHCKVATVHSFANPNVR